jgi:hypothetical protein
MNVSQNGGARGIYLLAEIGISSMEDRLRCAAQFVNVTA